MSLIETVEIIKKLNTELRHQEDEYENTSDFLEWFYYNLYRGQGFTLYPILSTIVKESEYECMRELCKTHINVNTVKTMDSKTIVANYENMKQWTLNAILNAILSATEKSITL